MLPGRHQLCAPTVGTLKVGVAGVAVVAVGWVLGLVHRPKSRFGPIVVYLQCVDAQ
jgi:hypothetical protein